MSSNNAPEPAMASRTTLVDFFSRSLTAFQSSKDAFRVVCTLPRRSSATAGHDDIGATPASRRPEEERPRRRVKSLVVLDSSSNPPTLAHLRMAVSAVRDLQLGTSERSKPVATEGGPGEGGGVRLLLLLAVNNADKKPKPAAFPARLGMMHAFAADLRDELSRTTTAPSRGGGVEVDVDLGLTTMPYFHDKSQAISDSGFYAVDGEGPEQVYLAGYDTLIRIFNPKYYNAAAAPPPSGAAMGEQVVAPIRRALDPFIERSRLRITMRTDDEWGDEREQLAYLAKLRDGGLEEVGGRGEWVGRVEMVRGMGEVVSSTKVREAASRGDEGQLRGLVSLSVKEWVLEEGLYREE